MEIFIDDIIERILGNLDRKLSSVELIDDYTIKFCNVKWASLFNGIIVDGEIKQIESVNNENNTIKFIDEVFNSTDFELPDTVFFIGSEMRTSSEWLNCSHDLRNKIPFVWCNLTSRMTIEDRREDLTPFDETYNNVQIFFIADFNKTQWQVQETLDKRTKILKSWTRAFNDTIKTTPGLALNGSPSMVAFPEFGREQRNGVVAQIIEENLSAVGVELSIDVTAQDCKC